MCAVMLIVIYHPIHVFIKTILTRVINFNLVRLNSSIRASTYIHKIMTKWEYLFVSLLASANAFSVNQGMAGKALFKRQPLVNPCRMAAVDDEIAALRAAAQKAREDAAMLEKALGKEVSDTSNFTAKKIDAPVRNVQLTAEEVRKSLSSINFASGDASSQVSTLDALTSNQKLGLWKAALTSSVNTNSPSPLRPFPVTLNFLEQRTNGQITSKSLGVSGEDDVSLDDFKYATLWITGGASVLGVAALAFLPENIGATVCYLVALVPILWLSIGSTAPGLIAGAIAATRGTSEERDQQEDRVCRHEAGHFLCGYLCGLPVRSYQTNDLGIPCVEFYPVTDGEGRGREFTSEEIAILSVVAMSGSVAEVQTFGVAKGGQNDLIALDQYFRNSKEFIGAEKQQNLTRWGALTAYNIINANKDKFERLVEAFKAKKSVEGCIAAIEGNN